MYLQVTCVNEFRCRAKTFKTGSYLDGTSAYSLHG